MHRKYYIEFIVLYKVFLKYFCYFLPFQSLIPLIHHSFIHLFIHLFIHPSIMPKNRIKPETSGDAHRVPLFYSEKTCMNSFGVLISAPPKLEPTMGSD